jgi:dihydroorotate dehydrogenase
MLGGLSGLALPFLHALEPEKAHELTLRALETGLFNEPAPDDPRLGQEIMGLKFPNPVGIAAGFDKDARVFRSILDAGFGFAEVGSITPRAQTGNPRPRVFRLPAEGALINRLGFNNQGHAAALARLRKRPPGGIVGVNIGANKDTPDMAADYVSGLQAFYEVADYFTVNISSPNTPGLRDLQAPRALDDLLTRVMAAREECTGEGRPRRPIAVKLSPDNAPDDLPAIVEILLAHAVDAIIVSNTTLARPGLDNEPSAREAGGLSGRPLFAPSTRMLAKVYVLTGGRVPLIGVGGIDSGETALRKIEAGASLIQLYTGLVYRGPGLVGQMKAALLTAIESAGASSLRDITGRAAADWAERA